MTLTKLSPVCFSCLALLFNSSSLATTLVFNVNAERSESSAQTVLDWQATGSYNFQLSVEIDENGYTYTSEAPQVYASADYYHEGNAPIASLKGESIDDINAFKTTVYFSENTQDRRGNLNYYQTEAYGPGLSQKNLSINRSVVDRTEFGEPYYSSTGFGNAVKIHDFKESFSITYALDDLFENPEAILAEDFITLLAETQGIEGAFDFSHSAINSIDECIIEPRICYGDFFGTPMFEATGIQYVGSATLVSISQVPLPAAGWLFFSSILSILCKKIIFKKQ